MKKVSFMIFCVFIILSCHALEPGIGLYNVTQETNDKINKLQEDIFKLSLSIQKLSATNSSPEDLMKEFAGKLSLSDEFALSGKPRYQSMTVVNSTFPEIQKGAIFKSDSCGQRFYFNGYFLIMDRVTLSVYVDEFGNHKRVSGFQFGLWNTPYPSERLRKAQMRSRERTQSQEVVGNAGNEHARRFAIRQSGWNALLSDKFNHEILILYPLKLTNHLHEIEFSAPQPLPHPESP